MRIVNASNYNEKRDAISHEWFSFLEKINLIPLCIPNSLNNVFSYVKELLLDGIILSGGDNIGDESKRDNTEKELLNYSIKNEIPIFGVCRGMQVINKFFGGTINVNLGSGHVGKSHNISLDGEISKLLGQNQIEVNSFHNNIILQESLGKDLGIFATHDDNTIEGIYHEKFPIMGVMWHPERSPNRNNELIVKEFFSQKIIWVK